MGKDADRTREQLLAELAALRVKSKAQEDKLKASNQELQTANRHLDAQNRQLKSTEQQLKEANRQLAANEAKLRSYFENAPDGIFIADEKGKYIEVNKAACEITGYSEEELLQFTILELVQEEYLEKAGHHFQSLAKEGFASGELGFVTKSGEKRFCSVDAVRLSETRFLGFAKDITESRKTKDALIAANSELEKTESTARIGGWSIDVKTMDTYLSKGVRDIYGIEPDRVLPVEEGLKFYIPEHRPLIEKAVQECMQTGKPYELELQLITAKGDLRWVLTGGQADYENGSIVKVSGFLQDITERKLAEEMIRQQQYYLRKSQELGKIGTWDLDIKENTLRWTDENCRMFGVPPGSEVDYEIFISKVHPDDREYVHREWMAGLEGKPYDIEHRILIDGVTTWVREKADITFDENGVAVSAIGVTQDISERKQAEEKLKASEERYRNLVDTVNSGVAIYKVVNDGNSGADYIIQDFNQFALEHEQMKKEEVIGKSLKEIRPNIDEYGLIDVFRKVWETGEPAFFPAKVYIDENYSNYYENRVFRLPSGEIVAVYDDVTERERAGLALKESEERFTLAMNASTDGLFDWNLETNEIYYSPGWKKMIGYEDHELPNDFSVWETSTAPEDVKKSWELQQKLISKQVDRFVLEFKMKHKDGHWVDILSRARALFNDEGNAIRIVGTHVDITERKRVEEQLRATNQQLVASEKTIKESERKFRLMTENSVDCIWQMDLRLNFTYISPSVEEMFGFSQQEWIGSNLSSHATRREFFKMAREALKGIKNYKTFTYVTFEANMLRKDGSTIPVEIIGRLMKNNKGYPIGLQGSTRNITDRKQAESEIINVNKRLKISTKSARIGIWDLDLKKNILTWDKQMYELYGIEQEESDITYETWKKSVHADDIKRADKEVQSAIAGENEFHTQFRIIRPDGQTRFMEAHALVNRDPDGTPISMIGINWDITERKRAEQELIEAKEKAEESDRLKTAFLNNMSHEIRTPMNGILGFTSLLKKPQLSGERKEKYIEIIERSGHRMLNTINDIIDISKIEAGYVKLEETEVQVNEILKEQFNFFYHQAKSKGLNLKYKHSLTDSESRVITDPYKLEGILINLIKNAIKYTEAGEITFGSRLIDKAEGKFIEFYVQDTGIGIPADRAEAIFNRFEQADIADSQVHEGTGLGLAISKSYVEMLGGEIGVSSKKGSGSTFTFSIPQKQKRVQDNTGKTTIGKDPVASIKTLSVIVAEDDETSRIFLETILENRVKRITFTTTGKETIESIRENPDTDMILLDIKMPGMNGFDAAREIRKFNREVIIIAQTAHGLSGAKEKALQSGCDDYIAKPIDEEMLLKKMRVCLGEK